MKSRVRVKRKENYSAEPSRVMNLVILCCKSRVGVSRCSIAEYSKDIETQILQV